jgi:hypothetical protein
LFFWGSFSRRSQFQEFPRLASLVAILLQCAFYGRTSHFLTDNPASLPPRKRIHRSSVNIVHSYLSNDRPTDLPITASDVLRRPFRSDFFTSETDHPTHRCPPLQAVIPSSCESYSGCGRTCGQSSIEFAHGMAEPGSGITHLIATDLSRTKSVIGHGVHE